MTNKKVLKSNNNKKTKEASKMENNEIKQTVVAVRERERESKRIKKTCSICGAQNRTRL